MTAASHITVAEPGMVHQKGWIPSGEFTRHLSLLGKGYWHDKKHHPTLTGSVPLMSFPSPGSKSSLLLNRSWSALVILWWWIAASRSLVGQKLPHNKQNPPSPSLWLGDANLASAKHPCNWPIVWASNKQHFSLSWGFLWVSSLTLIWCWAHCGRPVSIRGHKTEPK